jgi:hypothetical protein
MTDPDDLPNPPKPSASGGSRDENGKQADAGPGAVPPGGPHKGRRGSDLDAATGTLVGVGLGALIWVVLILLYLWLH